MKMKHLIIAFISLALVCTPVFAYKDKVKPINSIKAMDKASPTNLAIQTSVDTVKDRSKSTLHKEAQTEAVNPLYEGACEMPNDSDVMGKMGNHPNICQENDSDGNKDDGDNDDGDGDDDAGGGDARATDYNSSRSNKSLSAYTGDDFGDTDNDNDSNTDVTDTVAISLNKSSKKVECDAETQKKVCDGELDPGTCVLTTAVCHF